MDLRNQKVDRVNKKHVVLVNKDKQKFMLVNKKTLLKIDGPSKQVTDFVKHQFNRVPRSTNLPL